MSTDYIKTNISYWDELAEIHFKSTYYDVNKFKVTKSTLRNIEVEELGCISKKHILHLQCHFGMDTLSLANLGAIVTGVDFSEKAIRFANILKKEVDIPASFICANVNELEKFLDDKFDIVFASYGVLVWLNDLETWANNISKYLKSGGFFYLIDEHPFARIFSNPYKDNANFNFEKLQNYCNFGKPQKSFYKYSYANSHKQLHNSSQFIWSHTFSEVINSLVRAGLNINFIHEFNQTFYKMFNNMKQNNDGWWFLEKHQNCVPLMFSIKATKK